MSIAAIQTDDFPVMTKAAEEFRNYANSDRQSVVEQHYRMMRTFQTMEFCKKMQIKYDFTDGKHRAVMSIREAFKKLETYVDSSDPDVR